mmetsp:Transcript_23960/g.51799  ORF Transcript_23960/g.51799 Transcript_23960/m.51799 type:complete len:209 (+) Transcript_23960:95-721(+)
MSPSASPEAMPRTCVKEDHSVCCSSASSASLRLGAGLALLRALPLRQKAAAALRRSSSSSSSLSSSRARFLDNLSLSPLPLGFLSGGEAALLLPFPCLDLPFLPFTFGSGGGVGRISTQCRRISCVFRGTMASSPLSSSAASGSRPSCPSCPSSAPSSSSGSSSSSSPRRLLLTLREGGASAFSLACFSASSLSFRMPRGLKPSSWQQ